jgi:NAD(P)-dependent dehydrogenase (short-subunit alcohol dehydrogenase family)
VSSLAGRAGTPFQAVYSASKHALEGFVESLRHEIRPFGIQACLVEPGDFRTGFTAARQGAAAFDPATSPYAEAFALTMGVQVHDEEAGSDPLEAARLVERLLSVPRLAVRYTVGPLFQRFGIFLKPLIPSRAFELFFRKYYRLEQAGRTKDRP